MTPLPEFDESVEMREAIRRTAVKLALPETHDLAPYKQAQLLTDFLSSNGSTEKYKIDEISHHRWIPFVEGKTKKPHSSRMLRVAWDWMKDYCPNLLKAEFITHNVKVSDSYERLFEEITARKLSVGKKINLSSWPAQDVYVCWYRLGADGDNRVGCGGLHFLELSHGTSFQLSLPRFSRTGTVEFETLAGAAIPNADTVLLIGVNTRGMAAFGILGPHSDGSLAGASGNIIFSDSRSGDYSNKVYVSRHWAEFRAGIMEIDNIVEMDGIFINTVRSIKRALFPKKSR